MSAHPPKQNQYACNCRLSLDPVTVHEKQQAPFNQHITRNSNLQPPIINQSSHVTPIQKSHAQERVPLQPTSLCHTERNSSFNQRTKKNIQDSSESSHKPQHFSNKLRTPKLLQMTSLSRSISYSQQLKNRGLTQPVDANCSRVPSSRLLALSQISAAENKWDFHMISFIRAVTLYDQTACRLQNCPVSALSAVCFYLSLKFDEVYYPSLDQICRWFRVKSHREYFETQLSVLGLIDFNLNIFPKPVLPCERQETKRKYQFEYLIEIGVCRFHTKNVSVQSIVAAAWQIANPFTKRQLSIATIKVNPEIVRQIIDDRKNAQLLFPVIYKKYSQKRKSLVAAQSIPLISLGSYNQLGMLSVYGVR